MKKIRLWDAPVRIFHWSLFVLVGATFATGLTGGGLMDWHGRFGAIAFYARVKGDDLVKPMITGVKELPAGRADAAWEFSSRASSAHPPS
jgi:cytochrome b